MWEKCLENVRFGDRRNDKNRDEITTEYQVPWLRYKLTKKTRHAMYV